MNLIQSFDPSQPSVDNFIVTNGINKGEQLMAYNDSPYGIKLTFPDKSIDVIPAYWNKDFIVESVPMGKVQWEIVYALNNASSYPISIFYGTLYEKEERVASVNTSINRGIVVTSGTVNAIGGGTSSVAINLDNEGNGAGSPFIKSVIAGQTNPNILFTNDMIGQISVIVSTVLTQIMATSNVDPLLSLGALNHLVEILGNAKVDGTLTAIGATVLASLSATSASISGNETIGGTLGVTGDTQLSTLGTSGLATLASALVTAAFNVAGKAIDDNAGNHLATWTVAGLHIFGNAANNGPFKYGQDQTNIDFTITAISKFSGTGSVTVAHGLKVKGVGVLPDIVIPVQNVAGSQTMGYSALTTTNVTVTTGAGLAWEAVAMKL